MPPRAPRKKAPPKPRALKRMSVEQLLEVITDLLIAHIGRAPDAEKQHATIEAAAVSCVVEELLHGFACKGQMFCPREAGHALATSLLNNVHGAISRIVDTTGYVQ